MLKSIQNFFKKQYNLIIILISWLRFMYWLGRNYNNIKNNRDCAKLLKEKLENLGILGIKLGQYMCTRIDITSDIMKEELQGFLNNNKTHGMDHTMNILNKANINNIIIEDIIGSGSLTQAYMCRLPLYSTNETFVLKVKHPEIANMNNEIYVVKKIIRFMSCFNRFKFFINIDWNGFFNLLEIQLDLNNEKRFMEKYYSMYNNNSEITIPRYIVGGSDFIIMTYCMGKTLNCYNRDSTIYKKAHNLFACSVYHTFFTNMILHGDIHEGNILVRDDGTISIIDFGICIEFSDDDIKGIMATSKFENDPTKENLYNFVNGIIYPYDIYNKNINMNNIVSKIYDDYNNVYSKEKLTNFNDNINRIITNLKQYNVIMKNNILLYLLNVLLISGMSPYNEKYNMTPIIALSYMKKNKFFTKECELFLNEYYNIMYKKIPIDLIKKYNI